MKKQTNSVRLIETDEFPFEFLSEIGERESWRKEIHRPIYHVHKWWAKRLGSVFRGILLGSMLEDEDLRSAFYKRHNFSGVSVFDPFMGSGTTIGEAHKLGFTALGRDINPVAVESVKAALGPMDRTRLQHALSHLSETVGAKLRDLYRARDSRGLPCDVLYYFWVMQAPCTHCESPVDLFSSYIIAQNAYPARRPEVQVICPACGDVFESVYASASAKCPSCNHRFDPRKAPVKGANAECTSCNRWFSILDAVAGKRPAFRLYAKLVLTEDGRKEYLRADKYDHDSYNKCSSELKEDEAAGRIALPTLSLERGHNTRQAMSYGFRTWRDFFNSRQLLALGHLYRAINEIEDEANRRMLRTLFSGVLEFNNLFASYKGEGTGAVRHMFAHHILKPERVPIEANVWGTGKSSGSFSGMFKSRLLRAFDYRFAPKEVNGKSGEGIVCSPPFSGELTEWPKDKITNSRTISLSCGDSSRSGLPDRSIDLIVTDPPFFDNVHYSELADFFYAWQQLGRPSKSETTRNIEEVQDTDADQFARKLGNVFTECERILKDDGLLIFTYHHSREEGWTAVGDAILSAGFIIVNSQPVKSEMSVATPKTQAKEPIQLDIIIVCRKANGQLPATLDTAMAAVNSKLKRFEATGLVLSENDRKIVMQGQLLTTLAPRGVKVSIEVENLRDHSPAPKPAKRVAAGA
jgi:putative DNA methylase